MNKKDLGAFYTPKHTVNYMVGLLGKFDNKSNLLEPSGGDGAFVSAILKKKLLEPKKITVWDINPEIRQTIKQLGISKISIKDSLLETLDKTAKKESFSHIIGNPPYLNKQSAYIKKNKLKLKKIYSEIGANDTYAMFLYLGCKLLKPGGQLSFIVSDTFLTLGIHKKLRKFLLEDYQVKNITLCPSKLFRETGALVNTCIIHLENTKPDAKSSIAINDCRQNEVGDYSGKTKQTGQLLTLSYPDYVFDFNGGGKILRELKNYPKMIDFLDGGLGMHTTSNKEYLALVDYDGKIYGNNSKNTISHKKVDGKSWLFYHKKGGNAKYYFPVEYAIKWDNKSKQSYKSFKNILPYLGRKGFVISGISSSLSARISDRTALWESNKAMVFFPKEPLAYPPEFFLGLLNSSLYAKIIKQLNHTNSIQIRDIKKLPFFNFSKADVEKITKKVKDIIVHKKADLDYKPVDDQHEINKIVNSYFN